MRMALAPKLLTQLLTARGPINVVSGNTQRVSSDCFSSMLGASPKVSLIRVPEL